MKRIAWLGMIIFTTAKTVFAEPVFMHQAASIMKAQQLETGIGAQYGYQSSEIQDSPGTTYKNRVWQVPLMARYGITEHLESRLIVPIVHAVDSSEGLASTYNSDSGLGNIQMGAKLACPKSRIPMALSLDLDLPTANPHNNMGSLGQRYNNQLQQGFNAHVQYVADMPLGSETLSAHAAVGYMNTGAYSTTSNTRFNPSDLFTFGASIDTKLTRWVENLSVAAEFVGNSGLNHSETDGTDNGNDQGTVLEVGPTLRYQIGHVRTYTGFLADVGKTTFRAYNYRVAFGASLLWGGK